MALSFKLWKVKKDSIESEELERLKDRSFHFSGKILQLVEFV